MPKRNAIPPALNIPDISDRLFTIAEVAERLRLSPGAVRKRIERGQLPSVHLGKLLRVKLSDLEVFMALLPRTKEGA